MNTKKYMQTDSAWSGLGCPAYPCYIGRDGCGLVSIANILIEMEQYAQYTPATIQPYCKQFMASDCEGTIWSGVPVMLKHYGLTDVMEHQNFSTLWPELAKGNRVVFYIMGSVPGGSKRVKWSSGGHCVCSVDYKYEDGLHKVYMKDSYSNSELRNKWISYEENIRGACLAIWSGKLVGTPTPPPTPPKPGQLVVDGIGGTETVMAMQQAFGVGIDGIISGQATKWSNYYPSITAISFGGGGSQTIWKLQEWLNLSDPDGILGPNTTKAWQKRLRDYGYLASTETIDGIIGAKTMKAWQECLNNDLKPKGQPTPPTPTTNYKVIDVSEWQKKIDWAKVKADGVVGAIIRYAEDDYLDPYFAENMKGAKDAGLHIGAYIYSWAKTKADAERDAVNLYNACKPYGCDMPLYIDLEKKGYEQYANTVANAFIAKMNSLGAFSGVYANLNWWNNYLTKVTPPARWVAQYYHECEYEGDYGMWQYTSNGSVNGISDVVDMNECYVAYWDKIKPEPAPPTPPTPTGEHYPGPYPVVKYYLEPGDKGENVTRLQNYLNWYTDGEFFEKCGGADGIYGNNTLKYVKKMQTDFFGASEADGLVGNKTIAKMKEYAKPVGPTPSGKYTGPMPTDAEIREASNVGIRNRICEWAKQIADSGKYHYKHFENPPAPESMCPICHPGSGDGWNCIGFVWACWHHGGKIPNRCNCYVIPNHTGDRIMESDYNTALAIIKDSLGIDDVTLIRNNGKRIPASMLERGDALICTTDGKTYAHTAVYVGNNKIADSSSQRTPNIKYGATYSDWGCKDAIRYTGSLSYMQKSDEGKAVLEWQDFLDWWSDGAFYKECGKGDGIFGANTHKWTVKFQEEVMGKGQGDGTVGQKTITAAKNVVK